MRLLNVTLWLFNIAMVKPWPIEIDGLPFLKMGGSFHGELLVITRWYIILYYPLVNLQKTMERSTIFDG